MGNSGINKTTKSSNQGQMSIVRELTEYLSEDALQEIIGLIKLYEKNISKSDIKPTERSRHTIF